MLTENSFETQSLFEAELDKASGEMTMEGVREYWREKFASVHPLVAAAASTKKVKPDDMANFFNGYPEPSSMNWVLSKNLIPGSRAMP